MNRKSPLSLTLKQKLSTLSLAPSSPATANGGQDWNKLTSPIRQPRRKTSGLFGWVKRDSAEDTEVEDYGHVITDEDRLHIDLILEKLICQAGVDYETRPMVVITAAALPDPREISYDLLLERILGYLDLYVENDYSVVFLTAGGRNSPGWNWVWKAYRSLNRKYRKNLKHLYIVHSTWFSKMLFSLAGAVISPKFFRKIQYISTLSELAENVPLTQIDIAPAVYQENLKYERQIILPLKEHACMFGVPLEDLMGEFGENGGIPRVVKDCVEYLRECGMEVEGLFRRSPNSVLLRQAKEAYDRGHPVSLSAFTDPHIAAVLVKKFFRDLPEPIFHSDMYPIIRRCPMSANSTADSTTIDYIRSSILPALRSEAAEILLSYVFHLLHDVSLRSSMNRMDAHNLAVCLSPNLVGSNPAADVQMCAIPEGRTTVGMVVKVCIERYFEVFEEVVDRTEAVNSRFDGALNPSDSSGGLSAASADEDDDEDFDDAMLVMPLGPTPNSSAHSSPFASTASRSPPTAWHLKHKRKDSGLSGKSGGQSTVGNGSEGAGSGSVRSKHRKGGGGGRSTVQIERALAGNNGRGSITFRKGAGGTTKRTGGSAGGAGVEAVGVTALGFFAPPVTPQDSRSATNEDKV